MRLFYINPTNKHLHIGMPSDCFFCKDCVQKITNNANKLPILSDLINYKPSKRMESMSSVNTNLTFANANANANANSNINANVNAKNKNIKRNSNSNTDGIYDLK